jgi:hypothetical protein
MLELIQRTDSIREKHKILGQPNLGWDIHRSAHRMESRSTKPGGTKDMDELEGKTRQDRNMSKSHPQDN